MGLTSKLQALCLCILVFAETAEGAFFRDDVTMFLVVGFLCTAVILSTSFIVGLGVLSSKLEKASSLRRKKRLAAYQSKGSENGAFTWDRYLPEEERQRAPHMDSLIGQAAGIYLPRANMPGRVVEMFPMSSSESTSTKISRL